MGFEVAFTILLFFVLIWGFGFSALRLLRVKESSDTSSDIFGRQILRLGIGIPVFIVLGVLLNLVRIPLYWWVFLILALVYPLYSLSRGKVRRKLAASTKKFVAGRPLKVTYNQLFIVAVLLLFLFNLYTYATGSFAYPYLEDDDPWTYAREMRYVAVEKTLDVPYYRPVNYLDPYPPAFALIMGVLHQTSPEAQWTLKFFNSLLISLGILFFFYMVRELTKSDAIALASMFVISMLPSYLSHFIWSHTFIPLLFFLLIYAFERTKDQRWWIISGIIVAAILLTHPHQAIKLGILAAIYGLVRWIYARAFPWKLLWSGILGTALS